MVYIYGTGPAFTKDALSCSTSLPSIELGVHSDGFLSDYRMQSSVAAATVLNMTKSCHCFLAPGLIRGVERLGHSARLEPFQPQTVSVGITLINTLC